MSEAKPMKSPHHDCPDKSSTKITPVEVDGENPTRPLNPIQRIIGN